MKRIIISCLLIASMAFGQARRPSGFGNVGAWDAYLKTGTMTFTNKTFTSPILASPTISGTATVTAAWNTTGAFTYSKDADTLRFNLYQYLYPIDLEVGNTRMFAADSAGNVLAKLTFSPTVANGATLGTSSLEFADGYFHDGAVLYFGADQDVALTHVADAGLLLNTSMYLSFRDNALKILSSADGQLDIDADTEIELTTTTVDLNGILDVSGAITAGGGVALPTASAHIWAAGGAPLAAATGTDAAATAGDRYWVEVMIPSNMTVTGIAYLIGSVGGTDSVLVHLYNSAGTEVATSKKAGAAHADLVGTAGNIQSVDFATPYAATAGVYYADVQFNGTTAKFRTYAVPGSRFVAATAAGTFDVAANITPGTTFTADKGPILMLY